MRDEDIASRVQVTPSANLMLLLSSMTLVTEMAGSESDATTEQYDSCN